MSPLRANAGGTGMVPDAVGVISAGSGSSWFRGSSQRRLRQRQQQDGVENSTIGNSAITSMQLAASGAAIATWPSSAARCRHKSGYYCTGVAPFETLGCTGRCSAFHRPPSPDVVASRRSDGNSRRESIKRESALRIAAEPGWQRMAAAFRPGAGWNSPPLDKPVQRQRMLRRARQQHRFSASASPCAAWGLGRASEENTAWSVMGPRRTKLQHHRRVADAAHASRRHRWPGPADAGPPGRRTNARPARRCNQLPVR